MSYTFLLDAPGQPVKRMQVAKLGDFKSTRYGDFSITRDQVDNWRTNLSKLPGGEALIDLEHRSERKPRDSRAAGWITGLNLDGDRVMADVRWTPMGEQSIRDGEYRFVSPTYGPYKDEQGTVHTDTLVSAALTNKPFLGSMPAVTLESDEDISTALIELDVSADERKLALKEGNSLPDGSYPIRNTAQLHSAAILAASGHGNAAAAKTLIKRRAKELGVALSSLPGMGGKGSDSRSHMTEPEVLTLLDLPEDADGDAVVDAIKKLAKKAAKRANPDVKTLDAEASELGLKVLDQKRYKQLISDAAAGAGAAEELRKQRFANAFDEALREGKALESQRDKFQKFYDLDADSTLTMLAEAPQVLRTKPAGWNNEALNAEKSVNELVQDKMKETKLDYAQAYTIVLDELEPEGAVNR